MPTTYAPPELIQLHDILPSEPLLLMGAGPVPIPHAVSQANGVVINHLGDTMNQVIQSLKNMAAYAFQTESEKIIGVGGPSSAAMEMGITNLLWKGKKALTLENGTFSKRLGDMAERVGASVTRLQAGDRVAFDLKKIEAILEKEQFDLVTIVQGETSCGVYNSNLPEIAALCKAKGALVLVDAVCTLSTMPMKMDDWQIDVLITGGQKGLSSIPGVSLIAFSEEAWKVIEARPELGPHWCLNALGAFEFWGHQQYHYTAPVPGILALHEALRLICEETLEERFQRHLRCSNALQAGVEGMGLQMYVEKKMRLNSVLAINIPEGIDSYKLRTFMAEKYGVEISGAFGLDIIRIGQMGEQCRSHNLFRTLHALGMSLRHYGFEANLSKGIGLMEEVLTQNGETV